MEFIQFKPWSIRKIKWSPSFYLGISVTLGLDKKKKLLREKIDQSLPIWSLSQTKCKVVPVYKEIKIILSTLWNLIEF